MKRKLVTGVIHEKIRSGPIRIGVMYGERWYRRNSWRAYPLVWRLRGTRGFGIGPILIWDGK